MEMFPLVEVVPLPSVATYLYECDPAAGAVTFTVLFTPLVPVVVLITELSWYREYVMELLPVWEVPFIVKVITLRPATTIEEY